VGEWKHADGKPRCRPGGLAGRRRTRGAHEISHAGGHLAPAGGVDLAAPAHTGPMQTTAILFAVALWAGAQNALAGGGSFVTLPTLILSGLDARAANITSTIALFPGQMTTGFAARALVSGAERLSFRALMIISFAGGVVGALLLLATPPSFFARLVPWLVL